MESKQLQPVENTIGLMPVALDVDLVRFEKNLLQIGFFGANDARDKHRTSRRVEQIVFRNGHKVKVAAEFRGSEQLGLPSTTDRDKFIALLKIVSEERAKAGLIANPIRFSGYRMIQELGLSRNGEIYDEILRWGKRMTDTTITSEQVVYFAAKKVYSDEVLHVFRSFRRTGSSHLNGAEKQEHYEVVLEDWLLENLNQRYVIPEDFNAYKQLTRPTAKGIFGNLHLWFHASQGRQVEKDYSELCNLLNIKTYPHLSKIKSTMGLALNELVKIQYISKWDVQPMTSKKGYKIVLMAGKELLQVLQTLQPERRYPVEPVVAELISEDACKCLQEMGIAVGKAKQLVERYGVEVVTATVESVKAQMLTRKRSRVENPAGLVIYSLENEVPVVSLPKASQPGKAKRVEAGADAEERAAARMDAEMAYEQWIEKKRDTLLEEVYGVAELEVRLRAVVADRVRHDAAFARIPARNRGVVARKILIKELGEGALPNFEEWLKTHQQAVLF